MGIVDEKRVALFSAETRPVDRVELDATMDELRDC